jgi:hypothetical protein
MLVTTGEKQYMHWCLCRRRAIRLNGCAEQRLLGIFVEELQRP